MKKSPSKQRRAKRRQSDQEQLSAFYAKRKEDQKPRRFRGRGWGARYLTKEEFEKALANQYPAANRLPKKHSKIRKTLRKELKTRGRHPKTIRATRAKLQMQRRTMKEMIQDLRAENAALAKRLNALRKSVITQAVPS